MSPMVKGKQMSVGQLAALLVRKGFRKLSKPFWRKEEVLWMVANLKTKERVLPETVNHYFGHERPDILEVVAEHFPKKLAIYANRIGTPNLHLFCTDTPDGPMRGYTWYATKDYYEEQIDFTIPLEPHQVYQFDGYLAPETRDGLLAIKYVINMQCYYSKQGFTQAVATVDANNDRTLKFHQFLGFEETGKKLVTHFLFGRPRTKLVEYQGHVLPQRKAKQHSPG